MLEEYAGNLSKMELPLHLVEEIADLEGLGIDLGGDQGQSTPEKKLLTGSPSAKLAGVKKTAKTDAAIPISATTVENA